MRGNIQENGPSLFTRISLFIRNVTYLTTLAYYVITEPPKLYERIFTEEYKAEAAVMGGLTVEKGSPNYLETDSDFDLRGGIEEGGIELLESSLSYKANKPSDIARWKANLGKDAPSIVISAKYPPLRISEWSAVLVRGNEATRHCAYNGKYLVRADRGFGRFEKLEYFDLQGVFSSTVCYKLEGEERYNILKSLPLKSSE